VAGRLFSILLDWCCGPKRNFGGVETRLKQNFELLRKKKCARFTPEELLSAADRADAMLVTSGSQTRRGVLLSRGFLRESHRHAFSRLRPHRLEGRSGTHWGCRK
jgi:hypothetical protein